MLCVKSQSSANHKKVYLYGVNLSSDISYVIHRHIERVNERYRANRFKFRQVYTQTNVEKYLILKEGNTLWDV